MSVLLFFIINKQITDIKMIFILVNELYMLAINFYIQQMTFVC